MQAIKWNEFTVRMDVQAPPEKLYAAWATRAGIESWFLRRSDFSKPDGRLLSPHEPVQAGDRYSWLWMGWPDDTIETGTILEANGTDRFCFEFGKAGICTVELSSAFNTSIVSIRQDQIPDDEAGHFNFHVGCKTGWTYYLTNLKSVYQFGQDLRSRQEGIGKWLNL